MISINEYCQDLINIRRENIFENNDIDQAIDLSFLIEMNNLGVSLFDDIDALDEGIIADIKKKIF